MKNGKIKKTQDKKLKDKVQEYINGLVRERTKAEQPPTLGEYFVCCSCGQMKPNSQLQAGHFISVSRSSFLRFHPWNIHGECSGCNCFSKDHLISYTLFMNDRYGGQVVEELLAIKNEDFKKHVKPFLQQILDEKWSLDNIYNKIFRRFHNV